MSMIERVALAIMDANWRRETDYNELAKAAIAAMREPTDEMVDRGQDARLDGGGYYAIWEAMIDAALVED